MTLVSRKPSDLMPWEDVTQRNSRPSVVGELDQDVMDCGEPEATWKEMVKHLRWRARNSRSIAFDCEQTAKDAAENAELFAAQADDFDALADALERANVTFPASVDRSPEGQDREDGLGAEHESAVPPVEAGDAQTQSETSHDLY